MIEKLDKDCGKLQKKINELVDAVNELQKDREEIKEWIGIVSDLRSRVPVVESRVSILEEHTHPTARTEPADPYADCRFWTCYNVLCEAGRFGHTADECIWQELIRTRKALEIAVDALKVYANQKNWDFEHFFIQDTYEIAEMALKAITALEQKDVK